MTTAGPSTPLRWAAMGPPPSTTGDLEPWTGERLAADWVAEHHPGRTVSHVRTHSALHRGPGDLTWRVDVELDGSGPAEELTLLVHDEGCARSVSELPDDPLLPSLAALLRGGALEPLLRTAGLGPRSGARGPGYRATVVHHPREGACVLRVQVGDTEAYAKVYARADASCACQGCSRSTPRCGPSSSSPSRHPRLPPVDRTTARPRRCP